MSYLIGQKSRRALKYGCRAKELKPILFNKQFFILFIAEYLYLYKYKYYWFKLLLYQRPRNYIIGLIDYLGQILFHLSFCQYLNYVLWRKYSYIIWNIIIYKLIKLLVLVQNINLCWYVKGRRRYTYLWLRKIIVFYYIMTKSFICCNYIFLAIKNSHGWRRLKKKT